MPEHIPSQSASRQDVRARWPLERGEAASMRSLPWFAVVLCVLAVLGVVAGARASGGEPAPDAARPLVLGRGPHLLVDDRLIARSVGVVRKVNSPQRILEGPVVTGALEHQNWQPFFTVLYDPGARKDKPFRMWYNVDVVDDPADGAWFGKTGYLESADGIGWPGPYRRLDSLKEDGRVRFGASVLDDGPQHQPATERYKMMYFDAGQVIGPRVAFSADGLHWTVQEGPILPKTPSDDIWAAGYDPIRKRYFLIGKHYGPHAWTNAEGVSLNVNIRRYFTSFSRDFKTWSEPEGLVFSPDEKDSGITQWYGANGFQVRGGLILGFLRVLRDDLTPEGAPAEAVKANTTGAAGLGGHAFGGKGGAGMGYTVLTWTHDGQTWHRDRHTDKFFEPDPEVGAWDHAMAWIGSSVLVGEELYLYYAGYRWGHKYRHSVDRQIGLVKLPRDRFVAREAGAEQGTLTTPLVIVDGDGLTLNIDARTGAVRVQATDAAGNPIPGFAFQDCRPMTVDALAAPVVWSRPLTELRGRPVHLQFSLQSARLFAFGVE